ncbi:hypothetical protein MSG28_002270 [Choristoneura fumiferana]|uniref:Uncharacterized protein n=1 Tax=Choristoneura fumiferana TaxID=7141 RepID=A0ACC0JV57_CHOFU|nr:hypothetical protein MSG28_002270 [Choristoneura fumiferana]
MFRLSKNIIPLLSKADPRVLDAMLPYFVGQHGNPHSRTHAYGWESESAVEKAREQVAQLIGADPKEIIFTSGATESNNISEHKCVLDSCRALEGEGFKITYLPVGPNGIINLKELEESLTPETSLVSIMTVNNEIAIGKMPIDVNKMNIDLMSISGHKVYGPKGVGALYIRRRPRVRVEPIQSGGGQERGMRSGTVPTPLVVGLGAACDIAEREMPYDHAWMETLSQRFLDKIYSKLSHVIRNGESLLMALKDIALSSGSACTSASLEPSYVLRAIGTDEDLAHSSIRYGFGRFTTIEETDYTAEKTIRHVERLREMSPLWEMVQEGVDIKTIKWSQH